MKIINEIKKWAIQALTILSILWIAWITYAYVDFNQTIDEVNSNTPISASEYNKLVKKLNAIDEKQLATARVNFDWETCNLWNWKECKVYESYNILKVERISTWIFDIHFEKTMNTLSYNFVWSIDWNTWESINATVNWFDNLSQRTTSKFRIGTIYWFDNTEIPYNFKYNMLQIFWGK